jgi:predicted metal-dependent hydrolase
LVRIADNTAPAPQLPLWNAGSWEQAVRVRFSQRARRVAVRVAMAGDVELVVPRGMSESRARAFLLSRRQWVDAQVQRCRTMAVPQQDFPPRQIVLEAIGERWSLYHGGDKGLARIRATGDGLLRLSGEATREQWQAKLVRWLVQRTHERVEPLLQGLAQQHGFRCQGLKVRRQRTRWGSCSSRGIISINVALLFQPAEVLRYLLVHELAHTKHMNHSVRFWRCVAECEPDYRALDAQLRHGWLKAPYWLQAGT